MTNIDTNSISTKVTFEQWQSLSSDERDFFTFRSLQSIQTDVVALKKRRWLNPAYSVFGGFMGGFAAMAANAKIKFLGG